MMDHQARVAQGGFPAVINMLGEEIAGRSDHMPTKDVTMSYHELIQESRRRFGIWPYLVIYRYLGNLRRLHNLIWVIEMEPNSSSEAFVIDPVLELDWEDRDLRRKLKRKPMAEAGGRRLEFLESEVGKFRPHLEDAIHKL